MKSGTSAAGASVVTQVLTDADVPMAGVSIVDGSGLSTLDRPTHTYGLRFGRVSA